jgi:hypothetical protein
LIPDRVRSLIEDEVAIRINPKAKIEYRVSAVHFEEIFEKNADSFGFDARQYQSGPDDAFPKSLIIRDRGGGSPLRTCRVPRVERSSVPRERVCRKMEFLPSAHFWSGKAWTDIPPRGFLSEK